MFESKSNSSLIVASIGTLACSAGVFYALYKLKKQNENTVINFDEALKKLKIEYPEIAGTDDFLDINITGEKYIDLLGKIIGESEFVQNFPPEFVPNEKRVVKHVLDVLEPLSTKNGGKLELEEIEFTKGRSNLIIRYPGTSGKDGKHIGLIGSHLDVVPAVAEKWERDPFHLTVEGDKLYGRGTTDCLGHIALLTLFFEQLAIKAPELSSNVVAVFIASEEASNGPDVGVDGLAKRGYLENLKNGECLWIDSSDSEPCIGTAGALMWSLTATGKRFHSGFPNRTVNPIELGQEAIKYIQDCFYKDFPPHPEEKRYAFLSPTTFKPTQIRCAKGGLNQIPPTCTMQGDVRLTPFYEMEDVMAKLRSYVQDLNDSKFSQLPTRGPCSKYTVPELDIEGKIEIEFAHELDGSELMEGVACNIDSAGFLGICESVRKLRGSVNPYSICGSLPLVADMKRQGFKFQITGFGRSAAYHAENEYSHLSDMLEACKILSSYTSKMETYFKANP